MVNNPHIPSIDRLRHVLTPQSLNLVRPLQTTRDSWAQPGEWRVSPENPLRQLSRAEAPLLFGGLLALGASVLASPEVTAVLVEHKEPKPNANPEVHHSRIGLNAHALLVINGYANTIFSKVNGPAATREAHIRRNHDNASIQGPEGPIVASRPDLMRLVEASMAFGLLNAQEAAFGPLTPAETTAYLQGTAAVAEAFKVENPVQTAEGLTTAAGELVNQIGQHATDSYSDLRERGRAVAGVVAYAANRMSTYLPEPITAVDLAQPVLYPLGEQLAGTVGDFLGVRYDHRFADDFAGIQRQRYGQPFQSHAIASLALPHEQA